MGAGQPKRAGNRAMWFCTLSLRRMAYAGRMFCIGKEHV